MNIVLELKNKPKDGDILVYDKDGFKSISKSVFLSELSKEIKELQKLKKEIKEMKDSINILRGID